MLLQVLHAFISFEFFLLCQAGSLHVYIYTTTEGHDVTTKQPAFSVFGEQSGPELWLQALLDISNQTSSFTVAIQVIDGDDFRSDIAIDDVEVWQGTCPSKC